MTVDRESRERLADLAQKASPGPWTRKWYEALGPFAAPNAEYIAALDPETVLALLADLDTAERDREQLVTAAATARRTLSAAIAESVASPFSRGLRAAAENARYTLTLALSKWERPALAEHGDVS